MCVPLLSYSDISLEYETSTNISRTLTWTSTDVEMEYPVYVWLEMDFNIDMFGTFGRGLSYLAANIHADIHRYTSLSVNVADAGVTVISYATNCCARFRRIIHARRHRVDPGTTSWRTRFNFVYGKIARYSNMLRIREGIHLRGSSLVCKK